MTVPEIPAIPVRLARQPVLGGLAVPWITARTPDGRHRFGAVDHQRHTRALRDRLCQTCGDPLDPTRIVLAMRDSDLRLLISCEPAMHPVCAAYSATGCPMLAGRMSHYRTSPPAEQRADPGVISHGDPTGSRPAAPAERWHLLWATGYRPVTHPLTDQPAALLLPEQILRVRPIGPPTAPSPADHGRDTPTDPEATPDPNGALP
ncbi:hypothetical protein AWW66_23665 [Micromonospora rosaria]|uniref:Cell envelope biogenesis protein OmpA n=1 Tax=Micromonospora rosaria TaxID=47874 RepID=A0A136PME2_9ACTN|nr:hypothetical protein [Micromonospora rosaria]KXK59542.1 hypothetical protein AWW66_23665 [Micromonospora rosaria]